MPLPLRLLSSAILISGTSLAAAPKPMAAPFRPLATNAVAMPCPVKIKAFSGQYRGEAISGTASFKLDQGLCVGTIAVTGALKEFFDKASQGSRPTAKIIAYGPTLNHAAFVTPYGLFQSHQDPDDNLMIEMGNDQPTKLRFF